MVVCPVCRAKYSEGTATCPEHGAALLPEEAFASADALIEPGTLIGEYRVERKLGEGSFGAVYAGVQPLIGKRVAIKVLHKRMSSEPEVVARFIGEARAVNRIGHPNIVDVFSFGVHGEGQHYFVMELCDGLTLSELLHREKRLELKRALPIFRGIADALDAAHEAGITHRDLKPDNIFLVRQKDGGYSPKLLDFGVAKLAPEDGAQKTATGVAIGTPHYMSPEQTRGRKVDHRADIYSLGVVVHEVLTGKRPFEADSMMDLLFKHATEAPPPMSSVAEGMPSELDEPVLAMLAKRPAARPASAGAAIEALAAKARAIQTNATVAATLPAELQASREPVDARLIELESTALAAPAASEGGQAPEKDEQQDEQPRPISAVTTSPTEVGTGTAAMPISETGTVLGDAPELSGGTERAVIAQASTAPIVAQGSSTTTMGSTSRGSGPTRTLALLGVAAATIITVVLLMRSAPDTPKSPAAPPSPSASVGISSAEPATVTLRFAVTPADATVVLDGRESGPATAPLVVARGKTERAVRIEKAGYEAQTLWIKPDDDKTLGPISLTPITVSPAPPSASTAVSPPPLKSTAKPRLNTALERPTELGPPK